MTSAFDDDIVIGERKRSMLGYPSGDGTVLIKQKPEVRFLLLVLYDIFIYYPAL